ncbi:MAG: hypothetical protein AAF921_01270 [Cyanobacteria bacterium P01_D01_bin.44]
MNLTAMNLIGDRGNTDYKILTVGIAAITILVVILTSRQGISARPDQFPDARLFLNNAISITQGNWLGNYSSLTFVKGPFFPIFLAINFYLGLPILITQNLLYLLSGLLFIKSVQDYIKSNLYLLVIFCIYAFNPYFFAWTRITREPLYTSLTVLVIASTIGSSNTFINNAHINNSQPNLRSRFSIWNIILGISLGAFWMTREERIWLLPFVIGLPIALITLIKLASLKQFRQNRSLPKNTCLKNDSLNTLKSILAIGLVFFLTLTPVLTANYIKYGALYITEMQSPTFKAAYGALMRVKTEAWHPYISISKEARQKLYTISPSFKKLQPFLDGHSLSPWARAGCERYGVCDDIAGGWFVWAFRFAVEAAGFYTSPQTASNYFKALTQEINDACLANKIDCYAQRNSLAPRFDIRYIKPFSTNYLKGFKKLVRNDFSPSFAEKASEGSPEEIRLFESFLYTRANPSTLELANVARGWAFGPDGKSYEVSIDKNYQDPDYLSVEYLPSPDLIEHFKDSRLGQHRFEIKYFCREDCKIRFLNEDKNPLAEVDPRENQIPFRYKNHNITIGIDYFALNSTELVEIKNLKNTPVLDAIFWIYKYLVSITFIVSILFLFRLFLSRQFTILTCINSLLLMTIALRLAILTIIEISSFDGFKASYLMPCSPLVYLFIGLSLYEGALSLRKTRESVS